MHRLTATTAHLLTIEERTMKDLTASTGLRGLIAIAIFGALASNFSAVAAADTSSEPISLTVKFADLNLSSPAGALALYDRIRSAAVSACSYYWFAHDADQARCEHDAIANAVAKINRPALLAVYNAKNKAPPSAALVSQTR
jgi:UrcA family protein